MTEKQEVKQAIRIIRKLFQAFFGRIYTKDITLLETGFDGVGLDYILFRNDFTGRQYRISGTPETGDYVIDEVDFE